MKMFRDDWSGYGVMVGGRRERDYDDGLNILLFEYQIMIEGKALLSTLICIVVICIGGGCQECGADDKQFLTTFHPHLDAFWLNNDDQLKDINFTPAGFLYMMNQRNSKTILNSMLDSLLQNKNRRYFVTELVFIKDWYDYLDISKKEQVKKLVMNGQFEIPNGGWVENDQAVCYYDDILDQYTLGMNFLYEQFGYGTRIGWATDSFGHSHSQVALQNLLGIQFQAIERIDDRYIYLRKQGPQLQFYWQPISDSNNRSYDGVLTQVRHFLHEVNNLRGNQYGLKEDFSELEGHMLKMYGKNKLFRFLGNDFQQFTPQQFNNLQKLFGQLNVVNKKCNEFKYGNPSEYLNLISDYWGHHQVKVRKYDFMPNWDQDRYWVGYYTTDPQLKKDCKDFSRLVNLHRKVLLDQVIKDPSIYQKTHDMVQKHQELLAVMQHHDGITATSKTYIETLFKNRMRNASAQIINSIMHVYSQDGSQYCQLYRNNNECQIKQDTNKIALKVIHKGSDRNQRIQLILPKKVYYAVKDHPYDIFCKQNQCKIIFNAYITNGHNVFILQKADTTKINQLKVYQANQIYQLNDTKLSIKDGDLLYQFNGQYIKLGYYFSPSNSGPRKTMSWNKYGNRIDKQEYISSGMYIMFNSGTLSHFNPPFAQFAVAATNNFLVATLSNAKVSVELVIDRSTPQLLDWKSTFDPHNIIADFFLRAESSIKQKEQFYHDSNGYLVSKRKIGWRPDYDWQYKEGDKINANTYPACSFLYITDNSKKFVTFLDRARGVSLYDGALIVNIDRVASEDGKGVGQTFSYKGKNTFTQKFGIVKKDMAIERLWQKKYDQPLVGFISAVNQQPTANKFQKVANTYLKYNLFFLNPNEIVLRVHSLQQFNSLNLPRITEKSIQVPEVNLVINFHSIKQSFANGLLKKQRNKWIKSSNKSNDPKKLNPLEIKSYRINFKQEIKDKIVDSATQKSVNAKAVVKPQYKVVTSKHAMRHRCF